jgi:hypothetical protein
MCHLILSYYNKILKFKIKLIIKIELLGLWQNRALAVRGWRITPVPVGKALSMP